MGFVGAAQAVADLLHLRDETADLVVPIFPRRSAISSALLSRRSTAQMCSTVRKATISVVGGHDADTLLQRVDVGSPLTLSASESAPSMGTNINT